MKKWIFNLQEGFLLDELMNFVTQARVLYSRK